MKSCCRYRRPRCWEELGVPIAALQDRNDLSDSGIRLTLTGGYSADGFIPARPNLVITQQPLASLPAPELTKSIRLVSYPHRRQLPDVKTIDYLMAVWLQPYMKEHNGEDILYHSEGWLAARRPLGKKLPRGEYFALDHRKPVFRAGA